MVKQQQTQILAFLKLFFSTTKAFGITVDLISLIFLVSSKNARLN